MKPNVWSRPAQSKKTVCAPAAAAALLRSPFQRLRALACAGLTLALLDRCALQPPLSSREGQAAEGPRSQSKQGADVLPRRLPVAQFPVRNQHSRQLGAGTRGGR